MTNRLPKNFIKCISEMHYSVVPYNKFTKFTIETHDHAIVIFVYHRIQIHFLFDLFNLIRVQCSIVSSVYFSIYY